MTMTTMFEIQPGAKVRIKRTGSMWTGANIDFHTTTKLNAFTQENILIDPLSIFAPVENTTTARIKARWAECGYYGFRRDGWVLLVNAKLVIIGEVDKVLKCQ